MGKVEDKVIKNHFGARVADDSVKDAKSVCVRRAASLLVRGPGRQPICRLASPGASGLPIKRRKKSARDILNPHSPNEGGGGKREPPEGKGESRGGGLTLCSHPFYFYLRRLICKPGYSSRPQSECNIESESPDFPIGEIIVLAEVKTPHPEKLDRVASGLLRFSTFQAGRKHPPAC